MSVSSQVKSASRAIEILELFKVVRQPRGMTEISHALGYPPSSTTVLLKTLMSLGYLSYDRRERLYFPTPRVTALGDWVPQALFGSGRALDAMRDVHAATGETVSLCTMNDVYVQYIQITASTHALRFHVDEGTLRPLTQSATGWMLMSTMPESQLENVVRRANIATEKASERIKVTDAIEQVRRIRRDGYAAAENVPFPGGATLCVLLPTTLRGKPVVLGLGGALERVRSSRSRYLAVLRRAAKTMSGGVAPSKDGPPNAGRERQHFSNLTRPRDSKARRASEPSPSDM